jgi:hypothetical protein
MVLRELMVLKVQMVLRELQVLVLRELMEPKV